MARWRDAVLQMAGNETAVHVTVSSTSSGARARSGTRRRRRRRWVRRGEEARGRGAGRRARTAVSAGDLSKRNMAAGCCGAKKQRLGGGGGGAAPSLSPCDGTAIRHGTSQLRKPAAIAQPEMGFFCFDVLYCQLHQLDPPKAPNFINEALWVAFAVSSPTSFCVSLCLPSLRPSVHISVSLARRVSCCLFTCLVRWQVVHVTRSSRSWRFLRDRSYRNIRKQKNSANYARFLFLYLQLIAC